MKVLVAFATKAGSTKGIAEFLGERLRSQGMQVDVEDVRSVKNPGDYDAYVIGSAVYMFHWMGEAKQFVLKNRALFIHKPVWLFSSGPVGLKATNEKGQDLTDVAVSGPKEIEELLEAASPRDHRVFFGAVYAEKLTGFTGMTYRLMQRSKSIRESMPDGDYRDWKGIEAWALGIAESLRAADQVVKS